MKRNNIIFGVILVFFGLFLLLNNLDLIRWSIIEVAFDLWPLILIAVGASIVFNDKKTVKTLVWIGFFAIIIAYGFYLQYSNYQLPANTNPDVSYELENNVKTALLELDLTGVDLKINTSSNTALLDGYIGNPNVDKKINYLHGGERAEIAFREKTRRINLTGNKGYTSNFYLSDKITWDIDGDIGAVSGDMDLRSLKVNNINLDFGAGDINLLLGNSADFLNVDIDAGATDINVVVPKDLGVRVKLDGGLKHSNLKSLNWNLVNGWYVSPNYEASSSKASIDVDMGVGNFDLKVE
ncbi:DUF5668 domain-containing protein [Proteiniborus sp.]|uniref:LiaI-LiaF-like domain-containing protein n=1 Tax=Proteiniborus sp. TaxID=2079015 RepID=UPI003332804C